IVYFDGSQSIHGNFVNCNMQATNGQTTLEADVTFKNGALAPLELSGGSFLNLGTMIAEPMTGDAGHILGDATRDGMSFTNRGLIQIGLGSYLNFGGLNEGTITVDRATVYLGGSAGELWHNHGTINAVASTINVVGRMYSPSDFGDFHNLGGT